MNNKTKDPTPTNGLNRLVTDTVVQGLLLKAVVEQLEAINPGTAKRLADGLHNVPQSPEEPMWAEVTAQWADTFEKMRRDISTASDPSPD
ncbi:hypothetical protein [Yoonia sp. 208BN28-4]|uniref:hypothetical protein n=1 Tax=Yoonia sp. 208BN28-4 TaxID=3126505 RepID=UPI0030B53B6E